MMTVMRLVTVQRRTLKKLVGFVLLVKGKLLGQEDILQSCLAWSLIILKPYVQVLD